MPEQAPLSVRFSEFIQERTYCSHLRPETTRGYQAVFTLFSKLMPEVSEPDLLTPEMLTAFFMRLDLRQRVVGKDTLRSGVKGSTVKTYWSKLNAFFAWLHAKGHIAHNPLSRLKPPQAALPDSQALTEDGVRKMYSAITLHSHTTLLLRRDTVMVSLLIFSGLRLGEFISLEVRDIDFDKRILTVRGQTSKSQKARYIPIHPTLLLHLRDYVNERNKRKYKTQYLLVSSTEDCGLSRHGLKHWVVSLGKKSGVKFHLHQFRHAFACNLARNDVNAVKIQKLLGHSSLNMTMTYLRSIGTEGMQEDINKLSI